MTRKINLLCMLCFSLLFVAENLLAQPDRELERPWKKWIHHVTKSPKKLDRLYLKQALLVTQEESVFGQMPIEKFVSQNRNLFSNLSSNESTRIFEHSDRKVLDIGYIRIEDEHQIVIDSVHYVVAWRRVGSDWLRELDVILPVGDDDPHVGSKLDQLRSTWVGYANSPNYATLVDSLFHHDAMYLNNSQMSKGHQAITQRFDFMKSPNFHINLKKQNVLPVDDSTVIDIGNWITNEFVGYYLILWQKTENGEWKILLYFNF